MNIESAVIVITGASSVIGRATALMAADKKAHLVLASREDNVSLRSQKNAGAAGLVLYPCKQMSRRKNRCRLSRGKPLKPLDASTYGSTTPPSACWPPLRMLSAAILSCIEKPRREVDVGDVRRKMALHGLAQPLAERMIATKFDKKHFGDDPAEATSGSLFETMRGSHGVHGGWSHANGNGRKIALLTLVATGVAGAAAYYLYQKRSSAGPLRRMRKRFACALP